jgi:hypothetical protein
VRETITRAPRIASITQFQGDWFVANPKWTNPTANTTAQRHCHQCRHRGDGTLWWHNDNAAHASESETPSSETTSEVVQLAEHRLAPLDTVGGKQSGRPLQQPDRNVAWHRRRVLSRVLATPQNRPYARQ